MSKLIVNICCLFIFKRKNRHRFRVKYNNLSFKKIIQEGIDNIKNLKVLFGVNKKLEVIKYDGKNYFLDKLSIEIKQTFFKSEIDYENRKYNNTFIVNITNDNMSGLTDQIFYSLYCIELNKRLNGKYKFIFLTGKKNGFRKYILSHYNNLKDYVDFEIMEELPNEIKYLYEKYELTSNLYKMEQIKKPPLFIDTMLREFKYIKMGGGGAFTLTTPLTKANEKKLKQIKETPNSVCIHIRMGDVLAPNSMYPLAKLSYIKRSIANIKKQLRGPVTFFVFSDSKLAKKIGKEYDYVNINNYDKGYFDLDLMKNCQHFICSTGSFSGLAAEMGEYNKKLVFKPYKNDVCVNQAEKEKEWEYKWIGDQTDCENLNDKSNIKIL